MPGNCKHENSVWQSLWLTEQQQSSPEQTSICCLTHFPAQSEGKQLLGIQRLILLSKSAHKNSRVARAAARAVLTYSLSFIAEQLA